jgi:hypothetical protein
MRNKYTTPKSKGTSNSDRKKEEEEEGRGGRRRREREKERRADLCISFVVLFLCDSLQHRIFLENFFS